MRFICVLALVCVSVTSLGQSRASAQTPGTLVPGSAPILPGNGALVPPGTPVSQAPAQFSQAPALSPPLSGPAPASQSCLPVGRQWPEDRLAAIVGSPVQLLTRSPLGGGQLSGEVRGVVATQPDALEAVISLVPSANISQKIAIAVGLAGAALACVQARPDVAGAIQARVVSLGDKEFQTAFAETTGGPATAATGTAGLSAPAVSGPAPALGSGFAPGSFGGAAFEGANNGPNSLFRNVVGSSFDSTTAARNSSIGSVSPTQP